MIRSANQTWLTQAKEILNHGHLISPRGMRTRELVGSQTVIDSRQPVLTLSGRRMGYRFMAAEAAWILSGDNRVATIAPYAKGIARYSDNGETFFGAYGPKILDQWYEALNALHQDNNTRQAVINIWRENPPDTKDVPCTVSLQFLIRHGMLHLNVFMRSSDLWLGWPYDTFTQSMMIHAMIADLHAMTLEDRLNPGLVRLFMGSSHLYQAHWNDAFDLIGQDAYKRGEDLPTTPTFNFAFEDRVALCTYLWWVASKETDNVEAYEDHPLRSVKQLLSARSADHGSA